MESEAESEASSELKLPLFSKLTSSVGYYHPESPLHVSASVPFRWEEEPGKPRPCTSSNSSSVSSKGLELPPRLLLLDANATSKLASPTTVLEGPYVGSKSRFQSSSFRVIKKDWLYGSFRKIGASTPEMQSDRFGFGTVVPKREVREKGLFGSFRRGRKKEVGGDRYVFPSFMEEEGDFGGYFEEDEKEGKIAGGTGSFSALSHNTKAHFWATIYEGLKQVVPWRSRKSKRDGLAI